LRVENTGGLSEKNYAFLQEGLLSFVISKTLKIVFC
jgi:hypothetical protein